MNKLTNDETEHLLLELINGEVEVLVNLETNEFYTDIDTRKDIEESGLIFMRVDNLVINIINQNMNYMVKNLEIPREFLTKCKKYASLDAYLGKMNLSNEVKNILKKDIDVSI